MIVDKSWKNNNLLIENSSIIIDGVRIKVDEYLSPTIKYVQNKYELFNKKYFNNQLPNASTFKIKIVETNWYAGMTLTKRYSDELEFFELRISRYDKFNEKTICETILHEMIHIYQICVLKMLSMPHTESFIDKMNEINLNGWNISITLNIEDKDVYPSIKKSINKRVLIVIHNQHDNEGAFITYRNEADRYNLNDLFYKYEIYNIRNENILKKYYFVEDIMDSFNNLNFRVQLIKDEDIANMLKNKEIEMIPLREFLKENSNKDTEKSGYDEFGNYYYQSKILVDDKGREYQIVGVE